MDTPIESVPIMESSPKLDEESFLKAFTERIACAQQSRKQKKDFDNWELSTDGSCQYLTVDEKHAIAILEVEHIQALLEQAIAEFDRALLDGEARLADWEAKVSTNKSCLYQLKHDTLPEAGQCSERVTADRILRHLEHMIDAKGAAVESFTVQAATLKGKLKSTHHQAQHQQSLGEGLHAVDFDQLTIQNQELIAQFSQSNAALLCAKRKSAALLQALSQRKGMVRETMKMSVCLEEQIAACNSSCIDAGGDKQLLVYQPKQLNDISDGQLLAQ